MRWASAPATFLSAIVMLAPACAQAAYSERSVGRPEQIAWVRRAAERFLAAELAADGAEACAVLNAPLRAPIDGRSCETRWDARLAGLLREPGARSRLRSAQRAAATARVVVRSDVATIELHAPLLRGPNRFLWTESCWMLEG